MRLAKIALTSALFAAPAVAKAQTALEVQSWCRPYANAQIDSQGGGFRALKNFDTGVCWGAFSTIFGLSVLGQINTDLQICLPGEVTSLQMIMVFLRFMDQHPEKGHSAFVIAALLALKEAFPCAR